MGCLRWLVAMWNGFAALQSSNWRESRKEHAAARSCDCTLREIQIWPSSVCECKHVTSAHFGLSAILSLIWSGIALSCATPGPGPTPIPVPWGFSFAGVSIGIGLGDFSSLHQGKSSAASLLASLCSYIIASTIFSSTRPFPKHCGLNPPRVSTLGGYY